MIRRPNSMAFRNTHGSPRTPSLEWESLPLVEGMVRRNRQYRHVIFFLIGMLIGLVF